MAGASEIPLIINQLHRQDNFKKCAARPFACSGFVVNMTSGRTIGAETEEKYPYLNRDGVGMPAGREASGPLEASLWDGLGQARFVV